MKKITILILMFLVAGYLMAQPPAGINYQTVIRDSEGTALANTNLSLKMTIRTGTVDGEAVYVETHQVVTNNFGLVNVKIGMGTPELGVFSEISWESTDYFLETAIDLQGSGEYQVMGVSQFLSVPYALNSGYSNLAGGTPSMTTEEREDIENPFVGMQIYNTDTKCLNYYTGTSWYALCGECSPPNQANAGPDQNQVATNLVTLAANEPENGIGTWTIEGGNYGSFEDASDPNTQFSGYGGETYTLHWTISNDCGTSTDEVIIGFSGESFVCGQDFTDLRDGKIYSTVLLDNQCWMSENLNFGTQISGNTIQSDNGAVEKYCYDDSDIHCSLNGALYQWNEMMQYTTDEGTQGICPAGWHIPTHAEWNILENYVSSQSTYRCNYTPEYIAKALAADYNWNNSSNTCAIGRNLEENNATGFTALPAGYVYPYYADPFGGILNYGEWWTSSIDENEEYSWKRKLKYDNATFESSSSNKKDGHSVRCLMDLGSTFFSLQLEASPANAGTLTGAGQYDFNTLVNIIAEANPGWIFKNWTYNGEIISDQASYNIYMPAENITIIANFEDESPGFNCGEDFTDARDNQSYPTVQIGEQCWMAKNLNIGTRIDGTTESADNNEIEKYCNGNLESNCDVYGGLYQWDEIMNYTTQPGGQGICPDGWHLPEKEEWEMLIIFLEGSYQAGGAMKETGTSHWQSPNAGATNSSGFTALPAGERSNSGNFVQPGTYSYFSTSSQNEEENNNPWHTMLNYNDASALTGWVMPTFGLSVRCIKNLTSTPFLNLNPTNIEVGASQGTALVNVSSNVIWTVSESVSWLGVFPANGANDGAFTVNFSQNSNPEPRIGEITVLSASGEISATLTIIQQGTNTNNTCGENITDERDGQEYPTVQIGDQCWMAKNLNVGTRINSSTNSVDNGTIEKYCYNNLPVNCLEYGGLYKWDEMMNYSATAGTTGICPEGWHLPTNPEWLVLTDYLGGESAAGGALKEAGFEHWLEPNNGATNSSGFTALPAGLLQASGTFYHLGSYNNLWTSTKYNAANSNYLQLTTLYPDVYAGYLDQNSALTVRCIKDGSASSLLEVTPENQNVNYEAGTTTFEVTSNVAWTVEENVDWLTPSTLGNIGNAPVTVNYDENTGLDTRTGELTFSAGDGVFTVVVTITQVGFSPTFCGVDFVDMRNGEIYPTVKIGNQCWLGKNLNIGTLVFESEDQADNNLIEKYCYQNDNLNCGEYGGLYQWDEMMNYATTPGSQGICPGGWHIPTDNEWTELEIFLGGPDIAGGKMKEAGFDHWIEPNTGATNTSGFTALPGGSRGQGGEVGTPGYSGNWWSSTQLYDPTLVWYRYLYYSHGISSRYSETEDDGFGFSVRCLKNE